MSIKPTNMVSVAGVLSILAGCTGVMMNDFEKATEVVTLDIGQVRAQTKTIDLPPGKAEVVFVARGYDCNQPLHATLEVSIQGARGSLKQSEVKLAQLTWPRASDGCRPIGYLRSGDDMSRPLRFAIDRGDNPVKFAFAVKQAAGAERPVSIWVVYNDRNPVERMLGKNQ